MAAILVVDDDPSISLLLRRFLGRGGHTVTVAAAGAEAVAIAAGQEAIDAILTDLTLPDGPSGTDLIRELKALRPACPIIVASGHGSPELQDECQRAGAAQVLTKPFDLIRLQGVLRDLLPPPAA
jgi:CheY-like chemotaxis protein